MPRPLTVIPINMVNNRVVVRVPVADYELNMVLDTGATSTALFQSADHGFEDLEKTGTAQILFPALDTAVTGSRLAPIAIHFGKHAYKPKNLLLIHDRPQVGDRLNFKFDGVLGQDFFGQYVVEINPKSSVLRLHKKGTRLRRYFSTPIRLQLKNNAPHIRFDHKFPWERRRTTKELLLDTGFPGLMVIWNEYHFAMAAGKSKIEEYKAQNKGIFTRATFKIGRLSFIEAPIFIAANVPQQLQRRDGLIGANVLNQFHHVIDFGNRQLLLGGTRLQTGLIDGHFYLPNNEPFIIKYFIENEAGSKFVIQ